MRYKIKKCSNLPAHSKIICSISSFLCFKGNVSNTIETTVIPLRYLTWCNLKCHRHLFYDKFLCVHRQLWQTTEGFRAMIGLCSGALVLALVAIVVVLSLIPTYTQRNTLPVYQPAAGRCRFLCISLLHYYALILFSSIYAYLCNWWQQSWFSLSG